MMLLGKIWKNLREKGETPAYCCEGERISYRQLGQWTGRLCAYLKKNFPRCVCLYLPYEQCQEIQPQLKHDKIFYVENPRNLENLATLLQ